MFPLDAWFDQGLTRGCQSLTELYVSVVRLSLFLEDGALRHRTLSNLALAPRSLHSISARVHAAWYRIQ